MTREYRGCSRLLGFALSCALVSVGCSDARPLTLGICGNHVLEAGEDCDGSSHCSKSCRIECSPTAACPDGFGCDQTAGICRSPSGDFEERSLAVEGADSLVVADFDGDQRDDILSVADRDGARTEISYFNEQGDVESEVALPAARAAHASRPSEDSLPSIILQGATETFGFRASDSRTFSPIVGAQRPVTETTQLITSDVDCDGRPDLLLLGADEEHQNAISELTVMGDLQQLGEVALNAAAMHALVHQSATPLKRRDLWDHAKIAGRNGAACGMLALPAPDGRSVDVYGWPNPRETVQLAHLAPWASNVALSLRHLFFTDFNGDSTADLVMVSDHEDQPLLDTPGAWVCFGVGDGTFHSDGETVPAPSSGLGDGGCEPVAADFGLFGGTLTVAEIDGQPGLDLFASPDHFAARALDVTGDQRPDVVAVGANRRLDVFRAHETGLTTRVPIRLAGYPRLESVGDFDGDGFSDLLLSEAASTETAPVSASILFTPVTSRENQALEVARFEEIEQLAAAHLPSNVPDSSTDVAVLFRAEGALQLGRLYGGPDRVLRSPLFGDPTAGLTVRDSVTSTLTAHLTAPDRSELIVFVLEFEDGPEGEVRMKRFRIGDASVVPVDEWLEFGPSILGVQTSEALDLDGDGLDEIYASIEGSLLRLKMVDAEFTGDYLFPSRTVNEVGQQDADGDKASDLTLLTNSLVGFGQDLVVARARHEEDLRRPHRFALPPSVQGFAFAQLDTDPALELALMIGKGENDIESRQVAHPLALNRLHIYDVDWSSDRLTEAAPSLSMAADYLRAGDFNGDGVADLVGKSREQITLLLGVPR